MVIRVNDWKSYMASIFIVRISSKETQTDYHTYKTAV